MERLTRFVLAHRRAVAGGWLLLTLVGMVLAGPANKALDQKFTVPGREGYETNVDIAKAFKGTGGNESPLLAVVTLPEGTTAGDVRGELRGVEEKLAKALPNARISGPGSSDSPAFVSKDGRTAFAVAFGAPDPDAPFGGNTEALDRAKAALKDVEIAGAPVHLTGYEALAAQDDSGGGPGVLVEVLLGGVGALVVLAFVFGSWLAVVPLLMAVPAILTSFLAVYALTTVTGISPIVSFLIGLIGLGVAIDYALIIVVRWREERAAGLEGDEAIVAAMGTAGRAVVFSGTTVAIGLLALVVLPLPFLRSVGYAGMLIPLMSVLVALTLLPAVLSKFGTRLDARRRGDDAHASPFWTRWAQGVVHRRWLAAATALVVLGALVAAASQIDPGLSSTDANARPGDAKDGLVALERSGIGSGAVLPFEVLVQGDAATAGRVAGALARTQDVSGAVAPDAPGWSAGEQRIVEVFGRPDASTPAAGDLVAALRSRADALGLEDGQVRVGGQVAQNDDFIDAVYGSFPLMVALIAVITFILLARAFRSLLLPLKALVLNVISVGAAWGVMQLVWQSGHGSELIWGVQATGSITSWIPLMVFAFLFGLSMDYEVFILSRMREEYDRTGSTDGAVVEGIGRTGRLVTSAALILFLAFVSLASGPETDVKVLATGLAAGILIDATVIRSLLVPATVSLFGRWNWVLPAGPAKVLRVAPSLPAREGSATMGT